MPCSKEKPLSLSPCSFHVNPDCLVELCVQHGALFAGLLNLVERCRIRSPDSGMLTPVALDCEVCTGRRVDRRREGRAGADPAAGRGTLRGRGEEPGGIAATLRVSERSVERWRRAWRERGDVGVQSKGSPGCPRLGPGWNESWSGGRWSMGGLTSGGLWRG